MPRYAPVMSIDDLKTLIINDAIKRSYEEEYNVIDRNSPDFTSILGMLLLNCYDSEDDKDNGKESTLMDKVHADWSKVQFDLENYEVEGFELTATGVPYVMMSCGGDWEVPIACVVYWDGKNYRGYVPVEGNCYNVKTKTAFGNAEDEADDEGAFVQHFGGDNDADMYDAEPDWNIVRNAVSGRIEGRGTATASKTPVKSNAKLKAARQAAIEANLDLSGDITADMVYAVISLAAGCSYVEFILRASGRELTKAECNRIVGMPSTFRKTDMSNYVIWYSPDGVYPQRAEFLLKASGFTKDPKK